MGGSSFDFIQNSMYEQQQQNNMPQRQATMQQPAPQPEVTVDPHLFDFALDKPNKNNTMVIYSDVTPDDLGVTKKKRRKKDEVQQINGNEIIRAEGQVEEMSTAYTYAETTNMARRTIEQLDLLASEIKDELESVRMARTMNRKYDHIVGLSGNLGQLLATKISAIREINNSITKANDLDYRKEKDRRDIEGAQNDDKHIMDLYNAFVSNPAGASNIDVLGPSIMSTTIPGSPIIRATTNSDGSVEPVGDYGYLNYMSNMTPEQKMMYLEQDPSVKQVVVYDASNGNKFFQVMNMSTGQVITGVPVRDPMFLEDTTIDIKNKIAKNINLNEVYPLVIINNQITKEY